MLERMSNMILQNILSSICDWEFFATLCDETSDITGVEQLSVTIRTVNEELQPEEHFVGFFAHTYCDAENICSCILDVLQRFNLLVENLRDQCYDGAAVMAGRVSGT